MRKKYLLIFLFTFYFAGFLKASIVLEGKQADELVKGAAKIYLNDESNIPSFIIFREENQPVFDSPDLWLKLAFGLPAEFSLNQISRETDKLGITHYRYLQEFNGVVVDGTMWLVHVKNNKVLSMNGWLTDQLKAESVPVLNEQDALQKALQYVKADKYKWQMPEEEALLKKISNDPNATYFPKAILKYGYDSRNRGNRSYKLSYQFDIYSDKPFGRKYISVDATSGDIIDVKDRIQEANSNATAVTGYAGVQVIVSDSINTSTYRLRENGRGAGLGMETYNLQNGTTYGSAVDFTDADNYWNNINVNKDQYATDAHLAAEKTYDYYFTRYGRNSINNAGLKLLSYVHFSSNYVNAFWDGTRMTYGDGDGFYSPLTSLDIGGHEITHGLTEYTANLDYAFESGALNESFSDCFGTAVEWYADPAHGDWLIGEDIGSAFRSHSNPNAYGDPDTYQGLNWYAGTNDNGGVHTNSGVQNYWFYLLSVGGSGTNDIGNAFSVAGIGIDKAAAIAFRCLTVYLTSTSQYIDARNYSIQAAIDLFGNCSPEMFATIDAWYAVGVGNSSNIPTTISNMGPTTVCLGETVTLFATAAFGSTYQWYQNSNLIPGATNSQFGATTSGTYTVITNTCGTIYSSNSILVDVITLTPTVSPSGSVTTCDKTLLTANNTSGYNVRWNRNGLPINGATSSTYTATLSGNYSFTLSANILPEQTFSNLSVLSIPDNACTPPAISTISVSGLPGSINTAGITITINVTHTWDGDLDMILEAPNGDILGLSRQAGSAGDNFVNTVFSDNGAGPLTSGTPPFTGVFKPWPITFTSCINTTKTSFASIGNGTINPNGNWKFHVYDRGAADLGTIDGWSITFPSVTQPSPDCGPVTSPSTNVSIGTKAAITINPSAINSYQLTQKNNFSGSPRAFGSAVTINGKGYYGLGDNGLKNDWWEYDASTDSWTQKNNCPAALSGASAFVIGNKAYIVGGFNGSYLNSVYEWNSSTNVWLSKNNFPGGARAYLSSCAIAGRGYIVGGNNNLNTFQDIWEYDPSLDQWNFKTNISAGTIGRTRMTSFELASKMYFGLGQSCSSPCISPVYSNEWFEYNPQNNTITNKNNFPGNTRENGSGFAFGDKGYLIFGNSGTTFFTDYWEYDFLQDSWIQKGNYSGSAVSAASATVINNAAYIIGGNTVSGYTQRVMEFKVFSNICTNSPSAISLNASSGTSYLWSTGATSQTITGITSGDYSVLVNNTGCSSNAYANLAIYSVPSASISAGGPLTFCSGNSVNLTAGSGSSYLWSNGAATNSITVNTSGTYTVTVTGGGGCTSTSAPVSVISYPGPPVTVVGNPSLATCQGSSVTLNAYGYQSIPFAPVSGTGTPVTLSDDQLSGSLPIGFSFSFYNNTYTNFYISSNGFIAFGSTTSGCCTGQVLPNPTAPNNLISFAWNDLYPPAGGSIEYFTIGNAPNRKLVVKFNAIQHWPGSNPVTAQVILYETSNLIEIHTTLMPTNGTAHTMGIENISGTQAVIYPARNGTSWTATNDAVRFGTGIANYLWNTGPTASSITTSTAGNYSVTVTDGNNCSATSLPAVVTINPLPIATITANGPSTFCLGDSLTLTANSSASYLWSTGAVTQSIKVFASGNYSVTVSDANGCTKTSAVTSVTVSPCSAPVNLKVYIQGFYKGSGIMEAVIDKQGRPGVCDSLTLELHDIVIPHTLAYSVKNVIDVNGNGTFVFPLAALSNTYYLVVKHRNSMETWSSLPITMNSPAVNYDFTVSAAQSFGSNEANLGGGVFGIYSGDINQDRTINTTDLNQNMADAGIFLTGYLNSDLTGDWMVESADFSLLENNVQQAVVIMRP